MKGFCLWLKGSEKDPGEGLACQKHSNRLGGHEAWFLSAQSGSVHEDPCHPPELPN